MASGCSWHSYPQLKWQNFTDGRGKNINEDLTIGAIVNRISAKCEWHPNEACALDA